MNKNVFGDFNYEQVLCIEKVESLSTMVYMGTY